MTEAFSPRTLDEAVAWAAERPHASLVAGGTDLMVGEPEARATLPAVLDLTSIDEIHGVREVEGELEIGATTTFSEIQRDRRVRERYPTLAEAAAVVGGWQIQNRATVGGNVANASPAGDSLPVLLALDAVVVAAGPNGRREIPYARFHRGYRETALADGELIGWLRLPAPAPGCRQRFRKVGTREAQAISKLVVALVATVDGEKASEVRLAAGSVAPTPIRLAEVEATLEGAVLDADTARRAGRLAAQTVTPIDDVRSSADYRRFALERVVRRLVLDLTAAT